jgi:signal transduction histidine kinase
LSEESIGRRQSLKYPEPSEMDEKSTHNYLKALNYYCNSLTNHINSLNSLRGVQFYLKLFNFFFTPERGLIKEDKNNLPRLNGFDTTEKGSSFILNQDSDSQLVEHSKGKTLACSFLEKNTETIGFVAVIIPEDASDSQLYLFISKLLAETVSNLLEAALLSHLLAEKTKEITHLKKKTIHAQEEERKLIAFDIHDVISQRAAAIFYRLQTLEHIFKRNNPEGTQKSLSELSRMAQVMVNDITRLMFDLKPPHIEELGLEASLRRYIDQFGREYGITIDLSIAGTPDNISFGTRLTAFRITQEALTNIRKHAQVRKASVELKVEGEELAGKITDKGLGFDPAEIEDQKCLGLFSMKERAQFSGGSFEIKAAKGKGTCVRFILPLVSSIKENKGEA